MNKAEFLSKLADALDYDGIIRSDQDIASIEEWDSLGVLSVIELLNDMGLKIDPEKIMDLNNISSLIKLVEPVLED